MQFGEAAAFMLFADNDNRAFGLPGMPHRRLQSPAREGLRMKRLLRIGAAYVAASMLLPAPAFAYQNQMTPLGLHLAVSATGLGVSVILLVEALGLRKVALGGAIAEKIHFVILAIVCLAMSALAKWAGNFVSGITFEQTELISEALVVLAMGLLAAYFYSVKTAMQAYMSAMSAPFEPEPGPEPSETDPEDAPSA
jgi:hypothetical protein